MNNLESTIWVLVVIYEPDMDKLARLYLSIKHQVNRVVFLCNSYLDPREFDCDVLNIGDNLGIAVAQNIGSILAIEKKVDFILYADQDTLFPQDYVSKLIDSYHQLRMGGNNVAAVGPVYRDANKDNKIQPMVHFKGSKLVKVFNQVEPFNSSHIISSGMIVPSEVLKAIGLNRADFFIDWVDTEWCWRAHERGYKVFQVPGVVINHEIGSSSKKLFGRNFTVHGSVRNYYKLRNLIYMLIYMNFASISVKYYILTTATKMFFLGIYTSSFKRQEAKIALTAVIDGLRGKLGKRQFNGLQ